MRTTIVILISDSRQALWGHVGDSRLYCLDAGRIAFCTKDDSVVQAMVSAGDLSPREIRHHEDRNRLLRCLGNSDGDPSPDFLDQGRTLYRGTTFLLCTDGFWENVNEAEMEIDLAKAESPRDWLCKMETRLMERAAEDSDNYTAMAIFFDSVSAPEARAPQFAEDLEMNSSFARNLAATAVLTGIILIALAAAALGIWNLVHIRKIEQATANQSQELKQLQALPQRLEALKQQIGAANRSAKQPAGSAHLAAAPPTKQPNHKPTRTEATKPSRRPEGDSQEQTQ